MTALTSRYEVGESSIAAPRPAGGHGIDYGFIGTLDAETRRQRTEEVGYRIRDTWVDPREAAEEIASVTLEGVNTRVTELAAVQEQDTQDIYVVIEDAQDRQTRIFQSVETLIDDSFMDTGPTLRSMALGEIRALQARDQACADAPEGTASTVNNMPPRRSSATARAAAAAVAAVAPVTAADVE
ncbi:hypothetical protein Tco_1479646 [Tanacetum coccineum]